MILYSLIFISCQDNQLNDRVFPKNLIAKYPLIENGNDITSRNLPMTLFNAPFEKGGIYCNGLYEYANSFEVDPKACIARTQLLNFFDKNSFAVSIEFMVSEYKKQPVWIIGYSCRWLGLYLNDDSTVSLLYNNSNFAKSSITYDLDKWHEAQIVFDGTRATLQLDRKEALSIEAGVDFSSLETCGDFDKAMGVTNYATGEVYEGYLRNVMVMSPFEL